MVAFFVAKDRRYISMKYGNQAFIEAATYRAVLRLVDEMYFVEPHLGDCRIFAKELAIKISATLAGMTTVNVSELDRILAPVILDACRRKIKSSEEIILSISARLSSHVRGYVRAEIKD